MNLHIILAAGSGSRFGAGLPKQFCLLEDSPVICHTIRAIKDAVADDDIIAVVINRELQDLWDELAGEYPEMSEVMLLACGGDTRAYSVANALDATDGIDADIITIHDGARPLVDKETICLAIEAADELQCAALPFISLSDSIRVIRDNDSKPVNRNTLCAVQTPQAFPASLIRLAYRYADLYDRSLTDDASVYESITPPLPDPVLVAGSTENIKITQPQDIFVARAILEYRRSNQ